MPQVRERRHRCRADRDNASTGRPCAVRRDRRRPNLTQNYLNGAQEVLTAARTLQSNLNEAQMIVNQLLNLANLPQQIINSYLSRFQHILNDIQRLTQLVGNYDNLSYTFAARYPEPALVVGE